MSQQNHAKKLKIQKTPFKKNVPVCFFEKSYRSNKLTALVDFTNAGNLPLQDCCDKVFFWRAYRESTNVKHPTFRREPLGLP